MAFSLSQPYTLVLDLELAGAPVTGLTDAAFTVGVLQFRKVNPSGTSPAALAPVGGTNFSVEELFTGTYAFKFPVGYFTAEGVYAIRLESLGVFDTLTGAVEFAEATETQVLEWLAGKNTVTIVNGYDSLGQATGATIYGFATETDAQLFASNPPAYTALVRFTRVQTYTYEVGTNRLSRALDVVT